MIVVLPSLLEERGSSDKFQPKKRGCEGGESGGVRDAKDVRQNGDGGKIENRAEFAT